MRCEVILCLIACAAGLPAQEPPARFEVASVKLCPHGELIQNSIRRLPGGERLVARTVTLHALLETAYAVGPDQVTGGPVWLTEDRFDIEAKAPRPSSFEEFREMLRNLLIERFQISLRIDKKDEPVYRLTVANSTPPKLIRHDPADGSQPIIGITVERPLHLRIKGVAASMDYFAATMRHYVDRPIVNAIGLPGGYDFEFAFTMEPPASMQEGMLGHDGRPIDFSGPRIFKVLPDQFGLRLEPVKAPIDTLVIQRVARPSEN